jgi:hypothetical protein
MKGAILKENKLPSIKMCVKQAYKLACDVKEEEIFEGEALPEELIFYPEDIIKLIKYCQGYDNKKV